MAPEFNDQHEIVAMSDDDINSHIEEGYPAYDTDDSQRRSLSQLRQHAPAKFLLMLKEGRKLSQKAVKDISDGVDQLLRSRLEEVQVQVLRAITDFEGDADAVKEKVQSLFLDEDLVNPFKGLETRHQQDKYYRTRSIFWNQMREFWG
jgi:hypothetical protein